MSLRKYDIFTRLSSWIYTHDRVAHDQKTMIINRVIRKAKRILRKKSEPQPEANLKIKLNPSNREQSIRNSTSVIKRASMQEAVDYEIGRAKTNSKLSISMYNQLESRAPEYRSVSKDIESWRVILKRSLFGYGSVTLTLCMRRATRAAWEKKSSLKRKAKQANNYDRGWPKFVNLRTN